MLTGSRDVVSICCGHRAAGLSKVALFALLIPILLPACSQETETSAPEARPVRTVTAERREAGVPITMTGRIEAEDEVALSFRIAGRILESDLKVGDPIKAGQRIARLESQNERNCLTVGAGRPCGGAGPVDAGTQSPRATRNPSGTRLDNARQLRSSPTRASNRTIPGRGGGSAIEDGP